MNDLLKKFNLKHIQYTLKNIKQEILSKSLAIYLAISTIPIWIAFILLFQSIGTTLVAENTIAFVCIIVMIILMYMRYISTHQFKWWTSGQRKWFLFLALPFLGFFFINRQPMWILTTFFALGTGIAYGNRPLLDETGKYLGLMNLDLYDLERSRYWDTVLHYTFRYRQRIVKDKDGKVAWDLPEKIVEEFSKDLNKEQLEKFEEMEGFKYYYLFYCETFGFAERKYWLHILCEEPISDRRLDAYGYTPLKCIGYVTKKQRQYNLETGTNFWAQNIYAFNKEDEYLRKVPPIELIERFVDAATHIRSEMQTVDGLQEKVKTLAGENLNLTNTLIDYSSMTREELRKRDELLGEHGLEFGLKEIKRAEPVEEEKKGFFEDLTIEKILLIVLVIISIFSMLTAAFR